MVIRKLLLIAMLVVAISSMLQVVQAEPIDINLPTFGFDVRMAETPQEVSTSIQIMILLTVLALAPSILIMMTGFTRIVIVLSFVRSAVGTQQVPPNQVLIGLAMFLTFFLMAPVFTEINEKAYKPYVNEEITQQVALENAVEPIREFMLKQINTKDLNLFIGLAKIEAPESINDIPLSIIIPSFITSEIKRAFQIGFIIYVPFLIIDMVVASTLMSMGMMMLPPVMISLPFKILLFVMIDGWAIIIKFLISGFK